MCRANIRHIFYPIVKPFQRSGNLSTPGNSQKNSRIKQSGCVNRESDWTAVCFYARGRARNSRANLRDRVVLSCPQPRVITRIINPSRLGRVVRGNRKGISRLLADSFHPRFHSPRAEIRTSLMRRFIKDPIIIRRSTVSPAVTGSTGQHPEAR